MIGNVGTPTMVRAAPIVVETGTVFFGAFTGAATMLRDMPCGACAKYIFNVRASYAQEARATLEFFKRKQVGGSATNYKNLISFDQNDTFGQAGYDGLVAAYKDVDRRVSRQAPMRRTRSSASATRVTTTRACRRKPPPRGATSRSCSAANRHAVTVGILMTDTYGAATEFIKRIRDWQYANDSEQTHAA